MFRRKLKLIFENWRQISHQWFKERLDREESGFRSELEGRMLVQWSSRVDAQMLYMAQLEEKIKAEQESREALAATYERSLNAGVSHLNNETRELAANPLVQEISLLLAKQLMQNGGDPSALQELVRQDSC